MQQMAAHAVTGAGRAGTPLLLLLSQGPWTHMGNPSWLRDSTARDKGLHNQGPRDSPLNCSFTLGVPDGCRVLQRLLSLSLLCPACRH